MSVGPADTRAGDYRRAFAGASIAAAAVLLVLASGATFRGDDWDLVARRSLTDPVGLLRPFNEQWVIAPAVAFRLIFELVGMHSYLPYLLVLVLLHLLTAGAVWRLVAHGSGEFTGLLAGVVILFIGSGQENLHQAFQIGMVGSTAAGLWAIDAIAIRRRPALAALLLLISVASHAVGAVFLALAFLASLSTNRRALVWCLVPAVLLAAWFIAFNVPAMAARGGSFSSAVPMLGPFVGAGGLAATGAVFGLGPIAGALVITVLGVAAALFRRRPETPWMVIIGAMGLALEYGLVGLSRASFGIEAVGWSRYLYVAVPLVLVAVSGWFGRLEAVPPRRRSTAAVALAGLTVVAVLGNLRYYVISRDVAFEHVHRARAAAAIVAWSGEARRPPSDAHIPEPDRLRALMIEYGSPVRDELVPSVVLHVPPEIAQAMCEEMLPAALASSCEEMVVRTVGAQ